jgi:chromosome segregation ATPase
MIVRRDECIAVQREIAINAAETSAIYQKKKADKLVCDGTCQFSLKAQKDLKDSAADLRKANQTIQGFQSQGTKKKKNDDVATKNVEKILVESKELKEQHKLHQTDIKQKNKELIELKGVLEKLQNESVFLQGQVQILQQQQQQPQYMQHQQQQQQQQPQYMQQQQQQPSLQHMQIYATDATAATDATDSTARPTT